MSSIGIGDLAQSLVNSRNVNSVKTRLYTLNSELNSGKISDLSKHLGGQTTALDGIDRDLNVLSEFDLSNKRLSLGLERLQISFDAVNDLRTGMAEQFALITPASFERQFEDASARARADMSTIVTRLNDRDGDRALLSGVTVDVDPLADAEIMLADIVTSIGGATDTATIVAAVTDWFEAPGGGFETLGYLGDTGMSPTRRIGDSETISLDARADDPAIRSLLKGVALAAVVDMVTGPLSENVKADLMRSASEELFSASEGLVGMQALIGDNQERVAMAQTAQATQSTALSIARNEMILADPFETATRLQEVQRQLELQFTTTARMSQLSLVNYL